MLVGKNLNRLSPEDRHNVVHRRQLKVAAAAGVLATVLSLVGYHEVTAQPAPNAKIEMVAKQGATAWTMASEVQKVTGTNLDPRQVTDEITSAAAREFPQDANGEIYPGQDITMEENVPQTSGELNGPAANVTVTPIHHHG